MLQEITEIKQSGGSSAGDGRFNPWLPGLRETRTPFCVGSTGAALHVWTEERKKTEMNLNGTNRKNSIQSFVFFVCVFLLMFSTLVRATETAYIQTVPCKKLLQDCKVEKKHKEREKKESVLLVLLGLANW